MSRIISSLEDSASLVYGGRAFLSVIADIQGMKDAVWRKRLATAVEESGMSKRAISLAAKAGPGYVHSVLSEGKDPTVEKLMAVCDVLGVSPTFILYGVDVHREDAEIIAAMRRNPSTRAAVLALLQHGSPD